MGASGARSDPRRGERVKPPAHLALDDCGTGYSSLSCLRLFPIDTLKIDIGFVSEITRDPEQAAIAALIMQLARVLRLTIVAEDVETEEQLAFLRAHECDEIQGFLFSRPLPANELAAFRRAQMGPKASGAAACPRPHAAPRGAAPRVSRDAGPFLLRRTRGRPREDRDLDAPIGGATGLGLVGADRLGLSAS